MSVKLKYRLLLGLVAGLTGLTGIAVPVQAKSGLYIGIGSANVAPSGHLDSNQLNLVDVPTGNTAPVGGLGAGTGNSFEIGYRFTEIAALELFGVTSQHTINHPFGTPTITKFNAEASLALVNARISKKIPSGEVFARIGLAGGGVLTYKNAVFPPPITTPQRDLQISGPATALGVGYQLMLGKLGLQLAVTQFVMSLSRSDLGGTSAALSGNPTEKFLVSDAMLVWNF
jgi:hypothetical protein